MHDCPACPKAPFAMAGIAAARSASEWTMTPALPPSSSVIRFFPHCSFSFQPTLGLPVKVTFFTRASVMRSAASSLLHVTKFTWHALAATVARIEDAIHSGAGIVCGGSVTGNCLEATVIENAAAHLPICAEEAFAPVCTLHRYTDFEEALAFVNASDFGLQAGVYTRDLKLAMRAYETLEVGGVLINQVPTFRVENMPYGGVKDSGFGREGVRYAMEEMTELKSLVIKLA